MRRFYLTERDGCLVRRRVHPAGWRQGRWGTRIPGPVCLWFLAAAVAGVSCGTPVERAATPAEESFRRGVMLLQQDRRAEAHALFLELAREHPRFPDAYREIYRMGLEDGQVGETLELLENLHVGDPGNGVPLAYQAILLVVQAVLDFPERVPLPLGRPEPRHVVWDWMELNYAIGDQARGNGDLQKPDTLVPRLEADAFATRFLPVAATPPLSALGSAGPVLRPASTPRCTGDVRGETMLRAVVDGQSRAVS